MTTLRKWQHAERVDADQNRELREIVNASDGGLRWHDNVAPLVTCRFTNDDAPLAVRAPFSVQPKALFCLRAVKRSDQSQIETGARVTWSMNGTTITLHAIDLSSSSDEYDVTLGAWMG